MLAQAAQYADKVNKFADKGDWTPRMYGMMGYGAYGGGFPPLAVILWLVTWVLVVMVLFALFRWLWKKGDGRAR
jgi:uncharacterized membrane protein